MKVLAQGMPDVNFLHIKQFKCSLTGLTRLKDGRYRSRYTLAPGYAATAKGQIIRNPDRAKPGKVPKVPKVPTQSRQNSYSISKQIIRNRVRAMVNMMHTCTDRMRKPKLYFFTITFEVGTADDKCYQVFNTWLTELRQKNLLISYLWVAERQQNNTIHFHMAVPHYMNVQKINRVMRRVLIDQKNKGNLQHWDRMMLMRYNGVHISKNKQTGRPINFAARGRQKSLAQYLTKYITKNDTTMNRLAWHCSRDWSALIIGMAFTRAEIGKFVTGAMLDRDTIETEYVEFYRWANFKPPEKFAVHLGRINYDLLHQVTESTDILYKFSNN